MKKDRILEVKYPNYGVEITLSNNDVLLFTLFYTEKYGISLLVEDRPLEELNSPDEIISNINEEEILKEIVILEYGIGTLDVKGQRKYLPVEVKKVQIFDNDRDNTFILAGDFVKYSKASAEKYELNQLYAYDFFNKIKKKNNF